MQNGRSGGGAGPVLALGILGVASGAMFFASNMTFGPGELVALFVLASALGSIFSMRARLARARDVVVTSALAAAVGVLAFFTVPLSSAAQQGALDATAAGVFLGVAPIVAGVIAAGGSSYLAREMRKARVRRIRGYA